MEKLTKGKQIVLDSVDAEIEKLETKLAKVQPLLDELNALKKARAVLLNESGRGTLTVDMVKDWFDENEVDEISVPEIAESLGMAQGTVRSHFTRHDGVHYEHRDRGKWALLPEEDDEEEE